MKVCLSEIAEFITDGTHGSPERVDIGIPVLSAQNVAGGVLSYSTGRYTTEAEYQLFKKRLDIAIGDVLLTIVGSIGRAAVVRESKPAVFQRSVAVIRPKRQVADPSYLLHLFHSNYFQSELYRNSNQSSQAGVYLGRLGSIEIPLPPLEEQRRIAAILDQAKNVENLAARQLLNLEELACSFFQKAIADARQQGTLNEQSLGDISIVAGQNGATCSSAPYDANLPRYVRITDIQDNGLLSPDIVSPAGPSAAWSSLGLDPGDLLFARSGATVGKSYLHKSEDGACVFAGYLIRFRLDPSIALPEFVYVFTKTETYRSWIAATQRVVAQPDINAKQYASLTIPLPPLSDQEVYCTTSRYIEKQSRDARKRLAHVSRLRQSLSKSLLDDQGGKL